jgi:hypothetical protein
MEYKSKIKNCQNCKKDFTIESEDFNFYEKIKVSPPTFARSIELKGKCTVEFETSYAPERPEIVYCEQCYNQEIY